MVEIEVFGTEPHQASQFDVSKRLNRKDAKIAKKENNEKTFEHGLTG